MSNETGKDLSPLFLTLQNDLGLYDTLLPNGYFQFARGPGGDYDPVCFDFRNRRKNGDCRIVRIDHEAILRFGRIEEVEELAPNFRTLMLNTISRSPGTRKANDANLKHFLQFIVVKNGLCILRPMEYAQDFNTAFWR